MPPSANLLPTPAAQAAEEPAVRRVGEHYDPKNNQQTTMARRRVRQTEKQPQAV